MDNLIDQARLAHASFTNQRHHLAVSRLSPGQYLPDGVVFRVASYEAGQAADYRCLQAAAYGTGADEFKDLHRVGQAFDGHWSQGRDAHQALHQAQRGRAQADAAGGGELLHARRQVGGLAHGGVVHMQIVANGADDDFAGLSPTRIRSSRPCVRRTASV